MTRTIPVRATGGQRVEAMVDEADHARLSRFRWRQLPSGYVVRRQRQGSGLRRHFYLHREVVGATRGDRLVVEHVNGHKLDNRRANLRVLAAYLRSPIPHAHAPIETTGAAD